MIWQEGSSFDFSMAWRGVPRPVGGEAAVGSSNMDILLGGSYCGTMAAAVYELVAL